VRLAFLLLLFDALQKLRKIIEVFALEPVRRPAARSFSEEGEILSESLVRTRSCIFVSPGETFVSSVSMSRRKCKLGLNFLRKLSSDRLERQRNCPCHSLTMLVWPSSVRIVWPLSRSQSRSGPSLAETAQRSSVKFQQRYQKSHKPVDFWHCWVPLHAGSLSGQRAHVGAQADRLLSVAGAQHAHTPVPPTPRCTSIPHSASLASSS